MRNRVGDDLILSSLERQEDYIHEAADAIDAKFGMVLAAAAFLGLQPSVLLIAPHIAVSAWVIQIISFVVLCFAVGSVILRIRILHPHQAHFRQRVHRNNPGALVLRFL
jgi:hypothetical protein